MLVRWLSTTAVLATAALAVPPAALGGPPHPTNSTVPCGIRLVGASAGVADPAGELVFMMRNIGGDAVEGASIALDFRACGSDVRIASTQPEGVFVLCGDRIVTTVSDHQGMARIRILGAARNLTGAAPGEGHHSSCGGSGPPGCVSIYGDGVLLGTAAVAAYDQNGAGGVNPTDTSLWLDDAFRTIFVTRSDLDFNGVIGPADLSLLLSVLLAGGSTQSAAGFCD